MANGAWQGPSGVPFEINSIDGVRLFLVTGSDYRIEYNPNNGMKIETIDLNNGDDYDGGGGTTERYFTVENGVTTNGYREHNKDTFAIIDDANGPQTDMGGMGGTESRLFSCDYSNDIYEVNPDTLANIDSNTGFAYSGLRDIGGTDDTLFVTSDDATDEGLYEVNQDSLAWVSTLLTSPCNGVGGGSDRCWRGADATFDDIIEFNPSTGASIYSWAPDHNVFGLGGFTTSAYELVFTQKVQGISEFFRIEYEGDEYSYNI